MDERERRKERQRRADEAFFDGLLLGHYWHERNHVRDAHGAQHEPEADRGDDDFEDETDFMDGWD